MKTRIAVLLAVLFALLFAVAPAGAKDIDAYKHPELELSAVVTDEPCPESVLKMVRAREAGAELIVSLRYARATVQGQKRDACVLPKDEDGDYAIIDELGHTGWLLGRNITPVSAKPRDPNVKTI